MQELLHEAELFIRTSYIEMNKTETEINRRMNEVRLLIEKTGEYKHTFEELKHGARMAWRNSNRCIGRLFWESLHVFDQRELTTIEEVKEALFNHIRFATNQGRIKPVISIFNEKQVRIWNHQLIRYAGYESEEGTIGDPDSIHFTKICKKLGWKGEGGSYDLLPLVIEMNGNPPEFFNLPNEIIIEVPLRHPEFDWFEELHLKWYAVPIISSMALEIGGISYAAAPFNGWYMGTEIGARNLADEDRYNMLPAVGKRMGLDIQKNSSLWKDRALVELNQAVLYSYKEAGVSIVDHHTAAQQFKLFEKQEATADRDVTGDWTWLIPPVSPAATHIFHKSYDNKRVQPVYTYQKLPYE